MRIGFDDDEQKTVYILIFCQLCAFAARRFNREGKESYLNSFEYTNK